jgi:hypothetical protein
LLRGQEKSSARPVGALSGSPLTRTRAATGSVVAGCVALPPPSNWSLLIKEAVSGTTGPATGREGPLGRGPVAGPVDGVGTAGSGAGIAIGTPRLAIFRWISRST